MSRVEFDQVYLSFFDSVFDEEPSGNVEQGGFGESFELASVRRQFIRYFEK